MPPATSGAACDANKPCVAGLVCDAGKCATPQQEQAACTGPGVGNCDAAQGLFCDAGGKCRKALTAGAGQKCGYDQQSGDFTACLGGATCDATAMTCTAPAADGAACDLTKGPGCMAPAQCLSGTCTIVDPATCK